MRSTRIPLLLPACPHTELAFVPFFAYLWVSHNPEHHDRSTRDPPLPPQPPQDPAPASRLLPVCRSRRMDDPPRLRSPVAGRPIHHSRRRMAVDTLLRDRSRRPDRCGPPPQTLPAGRGIARRAQTPFHPETRKRILLPLGVDRGVQPGTDRRKRPACRPHPRPGTTIRPVGTDRTDRHRHLPELQRHPIRSTTACSTQLPARWNALSKSILPPTAPEAKGNRHPEKADSVPKRVVTASVTTFSYLCPQEQLKKSLEAWTNPNSNGCCGS